MALPAQLRQRTATYRINPEVEAKIDDWIKENPKNWNYIQAMPRDRLERTVVLNEVRQIERQQRMRDGMMNASTTTPNSNRRMKYWSRTCPKTSARRS